LRLLGHTQLDTAGKTPLCELRIISQQNTQQTQEADIHDFSGIRTRDLSKQATAELRLRPHDHRDNHAKLYTEEKFPVVTKLLLLFV
jgi:hypothetical protein